jgi:hypothetical protein
MAADIPYPIIYPKGEAIIRYDIHEAFYSSFPKQSAQQGK